MSKKLSKGYTAVEEEKERRDRQYEHDKLKLKDFYFAKDSKGKQSTEEEVTFLTDEPINYKCHSIMEGTRPVNVYCPDDDTCTLCAQGEKQRYLSAFVVFHHSPWERKIYKNNKDTGKTATMEGNIRMLSRGASDVLTLKTKKSKKGGLVMKKCTVIKGEKSWNFDDFDDTDLSLEEMLETLNDAQREAYVSTVKGRTKVDWDAFLEATIVNNEEFEAKEEEAEEYEEEMEENIRQARPSKSSSNKSKSKSTTTTKKKLKPRK